MVDVESLNSQLVTTNIHLNTPVCNPWNQPLKCPLILFIIIVILSLIWNIILIYDLPYQDRHGRIINSGHRWAIGIVIFIIYLAVGIIFGLVIYNYCVRCDNNNSWVVLFIFLLLPLIITAIIGILIGCSYGASLFFIR